MKRKVTGKVSILAGVLLLTAAVIAAPRPLMAQSNMHSAQSQSTMTPAEVVNQLLSTVERDIVPLAEAMPADKYNFAPTNGDFKGVRTFGDQVRHIAQANYYMFGAASSMKPSNVSNLKDLKTKEQLVQALKQSFAFGHQAIDTLTRDNAMETVKPVDGIHTRAGIMVFAIIHMNDHYGQMVEYARMNGVIPPASRHSGK